ncbi:MAG: hypothetical protein NTZ85_03165 [Bacteroidia bacterium]|nr:hypothetical protein [Bacteroidia bacterium]
MKKLLTLVLILCIGIISGNAFGQDKKKQEERKGGFAVGGFDNTRQDKAVKRSVEVSEEAAPAEKAAEAMPPEPAAAPVPPADQAKEQKELQGNQARSQAAKDKQLNKHSKSKAKHK